LSHRSRRSPDTRAAHTRSKSLIGAVVAVVIALTGAILPAGPGRDVAQAAVTAPAVVSAHPRLLASSADFAAMRKSITSDPTAKDLYAGIKKRADAALLEPTVTYDKSDGVRILNTSRKVLNRAYDLGFVWQMTGDARYADRLWRDLAAAASFKDWNPNHFLDTAEMTHAVAIGYDWLYDRWTPAQRNTLTTAIRAKGLQAGVPVYDAPATSRGPYANGGNWAQSSNNWNVVANSGLGLGALAVVDVDPTLANNVLSKSLASIKRGASAFADGGGYAEGLTYWEYAARYYSTYALALTTATGADQGLMGASGVRETGYFPIYGTAPNGQAFNFGDSDAEDTRTSALAVLGVLANDPVLVNEGAAGRTSGNNVQRLVALNRFTAPTKSPALARLPLDRTFANAGVATFRSSWDDERATSLSYRSANSPKAAHQNLDAGTFGLTALGETWAEELGKDDYGLAGYFDEGASGNRWDYYRERPEGQNTLVLDGSRASDALLNNQSARASFASNTVSAQSVSDFSPLYSGSLNSWKRGVRMTDSKQQVVVQDEVVAPGSFEARWTMHTKADIRIAWDGKSATLYKNGERLVARITSPGPFTFADAPASPYPTSPDPGQQATNGNMRKLIVDVEGSKSVRLTVQLTPLSEPTKSLPAVLPVVPLANWALDPEGSAKLEGITVGGKSVSAFDPNVLQYRVAVDPALAVPSVVARAASGTATSVTLPKSVPGRVTVTAGTGTATRSYSVLLERGAAAVGSVWASYTKEGNVNSTVDRDPATYWATYGDRQIAWKLKASSQVQSAVIAWKNNTSLYTKFEVETSQDGTTWTRQYSGSYSGRPGEQIVNFSSPRAAQYVRFLVHGDAKADLWTAIAEVSFYNYDARPVGPAAPSTRPESVAVQGPTGSLLAGTTAPLSYVARQADGKGITPTGVKFVTGNPAIAKVSSSGVITAVGPGSTQVGVVVSSNRYLATSSLKVTVTDPTKLRLYPSGDSYVQGGSSAGANFGSNSALLVKTLPSGATDKSGERVSYISFDLSKLRGARVAKATLNTYGYVLDGAGDQTRIRAYGVSGTFAESSVTYTNRPSLAAGLGQATFTKTQGYRSFDVTSFLNQQSVGGAKAAAVGFGNDTASDNAALLTALFSRESKQVPYLDIVLQP
jgi:hypothetical protein